MTPEEKEAMEQARGVLDSAYTLVHGDRGRTYDHPSVDFTRTAALVSAYLGVPITAEQIGIIQVLVKVSRLAATPGHRDSLVDIAGYAECVGMLGGQA